MSFATGRSPTVSAGRGTLPGEAVIQTYQPEHYAVIHAAAQDYEGFYEEEILYRELLGYPPAAHMLAVQVFARTENGGRQLAERLAEMVKDDPAGIQLIGPAPASIEKLNDIFRFVFYVKCPKYDTLIRIKDMAEEKLAEWHPEETVQFDFDPMNTM